MNLYLDSSALVKRYVSEPGSAVVQSAFERADRRITSLITIVETLRALGGDRDLVARARSDRPALDFIGVTMALCEAAVELSLVHSLRSMDSIQLAAALSVRDDDLTFATWDRRLHAAARAEGLRALPPARPS